MRAAVELLLHGLWNGLIQGVGLLLIAVLEVAIFEKALIAMQRASLYINAADRRADIRTTVQIGCGLGLVAGLVIPPIFMSRPRTDAIAISRFVTILVLVVAPVLAARCKVGSGHPSAS
jgi:hypothetical protein